MEYQHDEEQRDSRERRLERVEAEAPRRQRRDLAEQESLRDAEAEIRLRQTHCEGLHASSAPVAFAALAHRGAVQRPFLFVLNDEEEAGYFYHDLHQMLGETLPSIPQTLSSFGAPESRHAFMMRVKNWAAGLGLNEAVNYSFVGNKDLDFLGLPAEGRVNIMNPLTAEQDVLRTELAPGLFQNVRHNIAQGAAGVRLFEVAEAFTLDPSSDTTP